MTQKEFIASKWVRIIAALWVFVVPIFAVAIPALQYFDGKTDDYMTSVYGGVMWLLGPLVARVVLKMIFGQQNQ